MSKPVVQFDVDGVLAEFIHHFTTLASALGSKVPPYFTKDQEQWEFGNYPKEDISRTWVRIRNSNTFWEECSSLATPADWESIRDLEASAGVYFVTARAGGSAKQQTENWLRKVGGLQNPTVILSSAKGDIARALGATHVIDDKAGNAVYTAYTNPQATAYLVNYKYNQFDPNTIGAKVKRVNTVGEFIEDVVRAVRGGGR